MRHLQWTLSTVLVVCLAAGCTTMDSASRGTSASPVIDRVKSRGELRVGMSGGMPPLNMFSKADKIMGMDVDLAGMIAGAMGVRLAVLNVPFPDLLPALEKGTVDLVISNMTITAERSERVAFAGPYFVSGKALLTKRSTLANARSSAELNSPAFSFVALKDSTSQAFIQKEAPAARLSTARSEEEAIQMVIDDKADAMIADFPICRVALLRNPDAGLASFAVPLTVEPIGIAVPKEDPLLATWLENFLVSLRTTKQLEALQNKWFDNPEWLTLMK